MKPSLPSLLTAGLLAANVASVQAHGLWIEPTKTGASIHYGEYSHGEKEAKEKLAPFAGSLAVSDAAGKPVAAVQRDDGFYVTGKGALTASVADGPIYGEGPDATRYQSYLRYAPTWGAAVRPAADFPVDIVPVAAKAGKQPAFAVYKHGKAAGGAWVEVTAPNGWSKWFEADSTGHVEIQAPWSGLYVLHAEDGNETAGKQGEKAYAKNHQSAYLSIRKP